MLTIVATITNHNQRLTGNIQTIDPFGSIVDRPIDMPIDVIPTPADVAHHITQAVLDLADRVMTRGLHGWRMTYRSPDFTPDLMVFEFDFDGGTE